MRFVTIAILTFFLNQSTAQINSFQGRVLDLYTKQPLKGAEVELLQKASSDTFSGVEYFYRKMFTASGMPLFRPDSSKIVIKRTASDKDGYFSFTKLDTLSFVVCSYTVQRANHSFQVYHDLPTYNLDSSMIAQNVSNGVYYIRASCPYDRTLKLKHCPICKQKDKVVPIIWGLPVTDEDGNIQDENRRIIKDYYSGGCEIDWCRASKYCKRCKLQF